MWVRICVLIYKELYMCDGHRIVATGRRREREREREREEEQRAAGWGAGRAGGSGERK